jgi:hypothetical protein
MKHRLVLYALVIGLSLGTVRMSPASATPKAEAKKLFLKGKRFYEKGKYVKAINAFNSALRHRSHPVILFNIALCYALLKKPVEATTYGRRYLKLASGKKGDLPKELQTAMNKVGVVVIRSPDPAAEIYLDGALLGKGRVEKVALPGSLTAFLKLAGRVVARRSLVVVAGKETLWKVTTLPRLPRRVVERPGTTPPGSGGKKSARTGIHWVWVTTLAIVAVGAATGAGVMSMKTKQAHDDFLADRTDASLRDDGMRFETTANVLWGLAAAGAVTAVVLAIFTRWSGGDKERPKAVQLTPSLTPGGAGLTLTWNH